MTLQFTYEGTFGTGDGSGISVSASGEVYLVNISFQIVRCEADGTLIEIFQIPNGWEARSIAVAPDGDIWLTNWFSAVPITPAYDGPRLYRLSSAGELEAQFYDTAFPNSDLEYPGQVAIGPDGDVYVCSNFYSASGPVYRSRVYRLSSTGAFKATIGEPAALTGGSPPFAEPQEPGKLVHPVGVGVDSAGNVFVADCYGPYRTVSKFTGDGTFVTSFGGSGDGPGQFVDGGPGDFGYNYDGMQVAIDAANRVFVTDRWGGKVNVYDSDGEFLGDFTRADTGGSYLQEPFGIACGADGTVYVGDVMGPQATRWSVTTAPEFQIRGVSVVVCGDTDC